ncbi:uncharacterized protein LOC117169611 [Belonocnema kinseyi]|uniref:uncharacterized protein LOC117169611 n=1 Tax=Belonocnema kinseyi TaxID=2817044 RepID=UPI00143D9021|nr:uncharacterized protein LOC117169611 [Belonocnema kinseyi]
MKIIIGSSFWIFGWAVILNSIVLSSQSESPRLPPLEYRERGTPYPELSTKSGTPIEVLQKFNLPDLPVRKVRCPTLAQRTQFSTFLVKDVMGIYQECTPDKILLAIGPMIFGHILEDRIRAIAGVKCSEILYDERYDKQFKVEIDFLKENFNVNGLVPEHILDLNVIEPFGTYRGALHPRPPMFVASSSSEADHSSVSTSRSPRRSPKKFISKIFYSSSGRSS